MIVPPLSKARERLGLPKLPVLSELAEGLLEAGEDMAERVGLPVEEQRKGGETRAELEDLDE